MLEDRVIIESGRARRHRAVFGWTYRGRTVAALAALTLLSGAFLPGSRAQEAPKPAEETEPASGVPFFLKGVDLALPAQEAFRNWPTDDVLSKHLYPVPWSLSTFRTASLFGRPILLVLHAPWSHASERFLTETLRDQDVVRTINEGFLLLVVDADRRPEIRERYQTGSWPGVTFLLPDGRPMISSANPSASPAPITAGFVDPQTLRYLLEQARMYLARNATSLAEQAAKWVQEDAAAKPKSGAVSIETSDALARWLAAGADLTYGGFGVGPKFLVPGLAEYAAARAARGEAALAAPASLMLTKLIASPLYDRDGGGMHRIAMSPSWRDLESEKMIETNAHLLRELLTAARQGDSEDLRGAIRGTARFLTTVLARPGGGFYLAQMPEGAAKDTGGKANASRLDRLVLSGSNALAGAALLRAGSFLADDSLQKAGRGALDLVLSKAYQPGRGVSHVIEPAPDDRRYLADQAEAAFGLVDAFQTTGESRYLEAARDIVTFCTRNLLVPGEAAFRDVLPGAATLGILGNPRRPPRENALLARAMLRLHALGAGEDLREQAVSILGAFAGDLAAYGVQATGLALAIEEALRPPMTIRIDGRPGDPDTAALRQAALGVRCAWSVVATGSLEARKPLATISWDGETRKAGDGEKLGQEIRSWVEAKASGGKP
jgi:hypothetical protein